MKVPSCGKVLLDNKKGSYFPTKQILKLKHLRAHDFACRAQNGRAVWRINVPARSLISPDRKTLTELPSQSFLLDYP